MKEAQNEFPKQLQGRTETKPTPNSIRVGRSVPYVTGDFGGEREIQNIKDALSKGTYELSVYAFPCPCRGDKKTNTSGCDGSGE